MCLLFTLSLKAWVAQSLAVSPGVENFKASTNSFPVCLVDAASNASACVRIVGQAVVVPGVAQQPNVRPELVWRHVHAAAH
jgi:hypothetical protein